MLRPDYPPVSFYAPYGEDFPRRPAGLPSLLGLYFASKVHSLWEKFPPAFADFSPSSRWGYDPRLADLDVCCAVFERGGPAFYVVWTPTPLMSSNLRIDVGPHLRLTGVNSEGFS